MPKLKNIFIVLLVLGLIYAELLPTVISNKSEANSPTNINPTQSELLLSFFDPETKESLEITAPASDLVFIESIENIPQGITELTSNSISPISVSYTINNTVLPSLPNEDPPEAIVYRAIPLEDQAFIGNVIPKKETALFDAYNKGGRAWYQEDEKVIVIFPDNETFRSFNKTTGTETDWLQDRLNYSPIDSLGALENYTKNYHGEIIAETSTWALVKFPSGGYLKIAKPKSSTSPSNFGPFLTQE